MKRAVLIVGLVQVFFVMLSCGISNSSNTENMSGYPNARDFTATIHEAPPFELFGQYGDNRSDVGARYYKGGANGGAMVYGPYLAVDTRTEKGFMEASIEVEAQSFYFNPPQVGVLCLDIDSCDPYPKGGSGTFVVDFVTGTDVISSEVIVVNNHLGRQKIFLSGREFSGSLDGLEVRLHSVKPQERGLIEVSVFQTTIYVGWR